MYAYFAKKPLVKVITMRDKYTWEGLKLALGLTPQKLGTERLSIRLIVCLSVWILSVLFYKIYAAWISHASC